MITTKTTVVIFLCFFVEILPLIKGQTCMFETQRVKIDDTKIGVEILSVNVSDTANFTSLEIGDTDDTIDADIAKSYFEIAVADSVLVLSTTDKFQNLGKDAHTSETVLPIILMVTLTCDGVQGISYIIITISDTFRNNPIFAKDSYSYSLPMPIMPKTDFTSFGDTISISDINFSNKEITLTISPDHFEITSSKTDDKTFTAVVRARGIKRFTKTQTYTLTAVNSGNKKSEVPITIQIDEKAGLDAPSFNNPYYSFNYSTENGAGLLTPLDGDITISSNKPNEATSELKGDYAKYFAATLNKENKKFEIAVSAGNTLPSDVPGQLVLILSYTTDATANANLLINIINVDVVPKFSSDYYTGTYNMSTSDITWTKQIGVTDAAEVKLPEGSLFNIDKNTYKITPKNPLSAKNFDENSNIIFTLTALSSSQKEAQATVVISLKTPEILKFNRAYYSATYSEVAGTGVVTLDTGNDIGFSDISDFTGITINVDESYNNNFKFELDSNKWKIQVPTVLNDTVLKDNSKLAIPITATKSGVSEPATAVLILTLPEKDKIEFGSLHYSASYIQGTDGHDSIKLDQEITITGAEPDDITMVVEGFKENFELIQGSTPSYSIKVIKDLNSTTLKSSSPIIVTITATTSELSASTVLILNLPSLQLEFTKQYYGGKYSIDKNSKGQIILEDGSIQITKSEILDIHFSFEDFDDNFELIYDKDSKSYGINVKNSLNDSVLDSSAQLLLTITAYTVDPELKSYAVLILDLPKATSLFTFERKHYTAMYSIDSESKGIVGVTDGPIQFTNEDDLTVEFSFEGFEENFELIQESTSSYSIKVIKDLNSTTLKSSSPIIVTITATTSELSASTVLILNLPSLQLEFTKQHYGGKYSIDKNSKGQIILEDGSIQITKSEILDIHFSFEDFDDNFELIYDKDSKSYGMNVKNSLNDSVLDSSAQLLLTITAYTADPELKSYTVLILDLPKETALFTFERKHYTAMYSIDSESKGIVGVTDGPIQFTNEDDLTVEFSFEGFEDNFELIQGSTSSYSIKVKEGLNSTTLKSNSPIIVTITATTSELSASTVLILNLPSLQLEFTKQHYGGKYSIDENLKGQINLEDGGIQINKSEILDIHFSFEDFDDNFELIYDQDSKSYGINVKNSLNDSLLDSTAQLLLTITAYTAEPELKSYAVLILDLPKETALFTFERKHYTAMYSIDSESRGIVRVTDGPIQFTKEDGLTVEFSFEGFEDDFELVQNSTSGYNVNVKGKLNSTILKSSSPLVLTITASAANSLASTVLILRLPPLKLEFVEHHYVGKYSVDAETNGKIELEENGIEIISSEGLDIQFLFEGFENNFKMHYNDDISSYEINVASKLNASIIGSKAQLLITIIAQATDQELSSSAILVLDLPTKNSSLSFDKEHYSAKYKIDPELKATVDVTNGPIKLTGQDILEVEFSWEGYEDNFELVYEKSSKSYGINVKKSLSNSVLETETQLVITIFASTMDGSSTASTVIILDLPEKTLLFAEEFYLGRYYLDTQPYVKLDKDVILYKEGYSDITISFEGYDGNFQLDYVTSSSSYNIKTSTPLNESTLSANTQLVIAITATNGDSTANASTTLVLKLPSYTDIAFASDHYKAEYQLSTSSGTDELVPIDEKIKVKNGEYTEVTFTGYENNFKGICNPTTLECTLAVEANLNSSVLSSHDEILVTLVATNKDQSSVGKTALLLKLPAKVSTFSFTKQHYSAIYNIEKSDGENATIELTDVISLDGADSKEVTIVPDAYSLYFELTFDSSWQLRIRKNLEKDVLSANTELVISLTASKPGESTPDYAKATLIIKVPDKITVAFIKPQYYGEYGVNDDSENPKVVLASDSEIKTTDSGTVELILDSFTENFRVEQDDKSQWNILVQKPLNSSTLTIYSELKLLMTVTKIGVSYGNAGLTLKLPAFRFSKDEYSGSYSVHEGGEVSVDVKDIEIANIDLSNVEVNLTKYNEYFYTELNEEKWTLKSRKPLPASITDIYGTLVTTLEAIRQTDNKVLGTSTLVIWLPVENSTVAPKFSTFTFYGTYENSDTPTIELKEPISLAEATVPVSKVYIESSDEYATNFNLTKEESNKYTVKVEAPLTQDTLDEVTSIVLTLVAEANEGGSGYATLVIKLPKAVRNTSVQVENHEILFSGTYENGVFSAPRIPLVTNSTDDNDISVKISNDQGIDDKYFSYTYAAKVLSVKVDELPEDILNSTSVIPLKLAIKDRSTQDTIYAVLNVQIGSKSHGSGGGEDGDGDGDSTDSSRIGLIVAVSILAALLVLLLLGTFLFWFFKIRVTKAADFSNEEVGTSTKNTTFTKKENKKPSTMFSHPPVRRPTGLAIGLKSPVPEETTTNHDASGFDKAPSNGNEKKVAFNEEVEKIDEIDENDPGTSHGLQSVAERRPTKFVFGYPLEEGVLDYPEGRKESSDYQVDNSPDESGKSPDFNDRETKKSVAFDENVERMHIDTVEEDEEENESNTKGNESNSDDQPSSYKKEAQLQIGGDEKLPSQILKEIF